MRRARDRPSESEIAALVARGEYATAAEQLSAICRQQPRNLALRQKLAHVLVAAGERHKAVRVLEALVDDYAKAGLYGKAIAQAKRVQQIEPGRRSVEFKLAVLLSKEPASGGGAAEPAERAQTEPGAEARPPAGPTLPKETPQPPWSAALVPPATPRPPAIPPHAVETQPAPTRAPFPAAEPGPTIVFRPTPAEEPTEPRPALGESSAPKPDPREEAPTLSDEHVLSDVSIEDVAFLMPDVDDALTALKEAGPGMRMIQGSSLFSGLDTEQLQELIGGLRLTSVQPGEIIVAEGEPGASLFLIASGRVLVYVRSPSGRQNQVRTMYQGDFFGEISLLTGSRRTATITAASPCEVLELDRETVDAIAQRKPEVREIIRAFCRRRSGSTEEKTARTD